MPRKKLSQKAPCPCGSGKKYGRCCLNKGFDWLVDDEGNVFKSIPMSDELVEVIDEQKRKSMEKYGREPGPGDNLFFDMPPLEHAEHFMVEARMTAGQVQARLRSLADPEHATILARFFKTGPGEYGEGDRFIGVKVPGIRKVAVEFKALPLADVERLLHSEIHEERLLALVILVGQFTKGDDATRKRIYDLYLANTSRINNWDLVDLSAPQIVGGYLEKRSRKPLYRLARPASLWERRIAILATFHFIRQGDFDDTLKIAEMLLQDEEGLIHKAVGWMLREVGKRDVATLEAFLKRHCRAMPRTMLRYAIERFPEKKRQEYLNGTIRRAKRPCERPTK